MRRFLFVLVMMIPGFALAQDDDKGFLTGLLERNLSGAGREVTINGFEGALSSRARIAEILIADDQGTWLTLRGAALNWNRAALLRGRVEVNTLSAEEIIITRPPVSPEGITPRPAAAPGFSLPELPVSIRIDQLQAARVVLGAPVLGQAAELRMDASATLAGGEGAVQLLLERIDGKDARIAFSGSFENESRALSLDLSATEGADGLIAGLTGIPGAPPLSLTLAGTGPLSDYSADLSLATDAQERLAGRVVLGANAEGAQTFRADLGGDIATLVAPDYRAFFGPDIALDVEGVKEPGGRLDISRLRLETAALSLGGQIGISENGLPDRLDLVGAIASDTGAPVLLPLSGPETRLTRADFQVALGEGETPEALRLSVRVTGFERPDLAIVRLDMTGEGTVDQSPQSVDLALDFSASGIAPDDADLARAIGPDLTGAANIAWRPGAPLRLPGARLNGAGYALTLAEVEIGGLDSAGEVSGRVEGRLDDLSQFSGLAGRPLAGAGDLALTGRYAALSGEGEVDLTLNGRDLALDQAELDALLRGDSRVALSALRDKTGTTLRNLGVEAGTLTLSAAGALTPGAGDLTADLTFSDLSALGPGYGGALDASLRITGAAGGAQDVVATARGDNLRIGVAEIDGLLAGQTAIELDATRAGERITVNTFTAENPALSLHVDGRLSGSESDLNAKFRLPDLGVMGAAYRGAIEARARVTGDGAAQRIDLTADGEGVTIGVPQADQLLREGLNLTATLLRDGARMRLENARLSAASLTARASGDLTSGTQDLTADMTFADLSDIDPRFGGAFSARARMTEETRGRRIELTGNGTSITVGAPEVDRLLRDGLTIALNALQDGPVIDIAQAQARAASLTVNARGAFQSGASALTADLSFDSLSDLGPRYGGALRAEASLREEGALRRITLTGAGQNLSLGQAEADRLLRGTTDIALTLTEEGGRIDLSEATISNPQLSGQANATLGGADTNAEFTTRLANLGLIAPGLNGPLTAEGRVAGTDAGYDIAVAVTGPGGIDARIDGSAAPDFATVDLGMNGSVQTALANPFLTPRLIDGLARFDMRINGAPGPAALSGSITVPSARVVDPVSGVTLENIRADVALGGGRATLDVATAVAAGGRILVTGPVSLTAPFQADLNVVLDRVVLRDPELFTTQLRGDLTVNGPLTDGALISGNIGLRETEIRVPSTGLSGAGALPGLEHVNEPPAVRATRARAGLLHDDGGQGRADGARPFRLDVAIRAPERIFIRGRGLDAEMGGELRITGTTDDIIPIGAFELIRGRLDILGQRFDLDSGSALLQGELIPFINLAASTRTDDVQATIVISGPATEPDISFQSSPELPEEEVLAQILFGRDLSQISPYQALQLASAVQTLAGRDDGGIVSRLRQGIGLDDLDVTTDAEGNTGLQAGKYISRRIYSDVVVDSTGRSEINLNIDVTRSLRARGTVANDGSTGLGMFFERDY
jgi:translocation and assembly module TamB